MKNLLIVFVWLFFLPFLILAAAIAIIRVMFSVTLAVSWEMGDEWHVYLLKRADDFMQWLKK